MRNVFFYLWTMLSALFLVACQGPLHTGDDSVVIEGNVTGFSNADSVRVCLFHYSGSVGTQIVDTLLQDNGFRFVLDTLPAGGRIYDILLYRSDGNMIEQLGHSSYLFLEPDVHVRVRGEAIHLRTARIDSPVRDQKLAQRFLGKMSRQDWELFQELSAEDNALYFRQIKDGSLTDAQKDSIRQRRKELRVQSDSVNHLLAAQTFDLLETEEIGAFAMRKILTYATGLSHGQYTEHREQMERILERLTTDQKNSPDGQQILAFMYPVEKISVGDTFQEYPFVDKEGHSHTFSELRGKPVLVDFWSNGCGPCILVIPYMKELFQSFAGRVEFVSICLDPESLWKDPTSPGGQNPVPWNDWRDPKEWAGNYRAYNAKGIPTYLVISPEGILTHVYAGFDIKAIRSALNEQL